MHVSQDVLEMLLYAVLESLGKFLQTVQTVHATHGFHKTTYKLCTQICAKLTHPNLACTVCTTSIGGMHGLQDGL